VLSKAGRFGIIADDLTGAGDTGLQYHRSGLRTWVLTQFPPSDGAGVPDEVKAIAINAGSRHLAPQGAADRAADAGRYLRQAGCNEFYLKCDSTLRGNLPDEIRGVLGDLGLDMAVVAPAFPEAGRITVGGFQLVAGVPVALSEYGEDVLAPVRESHLPTLLAQTGLKVAAIDLRKVVEGWEAVAGALAEARAGGARVVVADAVRTQDLEAIARAIWHASTSILPVGSAGLAAALMAVRPTAARMLKVDSPMVPAAGDAGAGLRGPVGRVLGTHAPVLVVSGSPNPATLAQIKHLGATARLVLVDVKHLLLTDAPGPEHSELAMAARQALQGLLAGRDVIVTTALSSDQVAKDRDLGRELGMTRDQVSHNLSSALGQLARQLHGKAALGGLVAAGGETASAVCRALPGERLEIVEEVLPAIPLARVVGRNLRLVTKSGGFGAPESLRMIVEYLRQTEEVA
jgi:uncharacterized protein YgbK (DUF1537 family)